MKEVLDTLRNICLRFLAGTQSITADVSIGDTEAYVVSSRRFLVGEEIVIRDSSQGELLTVTDVPESNKIEFEPAVIANWAVADGVVIEHAINQQYLRRVYVGEPDVIPDYPAIVITGNDRSSEWWTIKSTKERWNCTITILVQDDGTEQAYETLLHLTSKLEESLYSQFFPLIGKTKTVAVTADLSPGDTVVSVSDTSGFEPNNMIVLEDADYTEEHRIRRIIDATTFEMTRAVEHEFKVAMSAIVIKPSRWVLDSRPESTNYGHIHKGTLLKASQISWFCEEEKIRANPYPTPLQL